MRGAAGSYFVTVQVDATSWKVTNMAYKRRKYTTQVLQTHAHRHRLKLLAFENITPETLEAAKQLICAAARRLAADYKPNTANVEMAEGGDGLAVVVSTKRRAAPFLCQECRAAMCDADQSHLILADDLKYLPYRKPRQ